MRCVWQSWSFEGNFTDTVSERPETSLMCTRKYNKLAVRLKFVCTSVLCPREATRTDDRDQSQLS